ncbi:phage head closure protein [Anaerobacillus isosaccharinicus]|uniref:Phage head closure protein n=1 Tax=Anaerobacillus isosaccharinicus TaxID=1532552 RepID=A0A1S2L946_9BACI|nr:phage head closure protein [Anaerobacillus isosaccharinicus]MBA5584573.1 phage head closure protein [Anaerobacillus isosaccharinicus]QOY37046.1 phage head closure protein [Anaerobacillus isosaccharinicus]
MNYQHNNNPAKLNKRITFFSPPGTIVNGWPSTDWTKVVTVWAEIKTQKGYRVFNSDATQFQDKKIIGMRYRNDIDSNMRVEISEKMHEMDSPPINDDERNQWLTLIVKEVL